MRRTRIICIASCIALLTAFAASPVQAVSIIWKAANVDITLGLPASSLEFENPLIAGKTVKNYTVVDWRDADFSWGPPPWYDDWTVSHPGQIDGNANEIWMRNAGQNIWTTTTVMSNIVSIHMTGDYNDGRAEVLVDGVVVAVLDMGTAGLPQTALIIVKNLPWSLHNVMVRDTGWGPISNLGDDVHTFGAAALQMRPYGYKWWPHFWFLNARLRLYRTSGTITAYTGYWGGWYPYLLYNYYWRPWYGPANWYEPYCYYWYRPYWDYWPWYRYYRPWWHYWRWRGGWWFWGFNDRLTYSYTLWYPRIIYYWSWYWDAPGQGGCMELVTQADEINPAGKRIMAFPDPCIPGFTPGTHEYRVNGGVASGSFNSLSFIPVTSLEDYYRSITGVTDDDVAALMESDIVQELMAHPGGYVGVQHATWTHPDSAIVTNAAIPEALVFKNGAGSLSEYKFHIKAGETAIGPMPVAVMSSDPDRLAIDGAGADGLLHLILDPTNPDPNGQPITVRAVSSSVEEEEHTAYVAVFREESWTDGIVINVKIQDQGCGGHGYNDSDLNRDCMTDFKDFAIFADQWCYSRVVTEY